MQIEEKTIVKPSVSSRTNGPRARRSSFPFGVVVGLLLILLAVYFGAKYSGYDLLAGITGPVQPTTIHETYRVKKTDLSITVTEDGNVESSSNVELKCQVEGGSQILKIVPEGTEVKKGTIVVELNSSAVDEQIKQQEITLGNARAAEAQAESDALVAERAITAYEQGTAIQELQTAESAIVVARQNLKNAENMLAHMQNSLRKGYINKLQLEANEDSVERAKLDLAAAETAKKVLVEFTQKKTLSELTSAHKAARAKFEAAKAVAAIEKMKLDRLLEQKRRCTITAPQDGMVIYANDRGGGRRGNSEVLIEEGAMVREYQTIIQLPDLRDMQVKALVHETKIDGLLAGMRANIRVRDMRFTGTVSAVMNQPEPGSWMRSSVKEYAVLVKIDPSPLVANLKPGMTAEVEIFVEELHDVLAVPLLAVVEQNEKYFCYVAKGPNYEKRPVVIGLSNDKFIHIKDGLNENEEVILNPRSTIPDARTQSTTRPSTSPGAAKVGPNGKDKTGGEGATGGAGGYPQAGDKDAGKKSTAKKMTLASFDKNADGKVEPDELPDKMRESFKKFDTNNDGFIDAKESMEAAGRMREGMKKGAPSLPPAS